MLAPRYAFWFACCVLSALTVWLAWSSSLHWLWAAAPLTALALIGLRDIFQTSSSVRRNYPVLAHLRYLLEKIRPEIRQYFLETDVEEHPFSRVQRSIVYQRAKDVLDVRPFGTQLDTYSFDYEWINHSVRPAHIEDHDFRQPVGGDHCSQPYPVSVFNISAMSFGSLSANAILALNEGAKRGGFYHDTGEGSISPYHRRPGGDLVWEIGSGYFGCRDAQGNFSEQKFAENAQLEQVKMIEIKLSQGAKPGHGGVLPGAKVTAEIAAVRGIPPGIDCISPAAHSAFSTPVELLQFVSRLRRLSGGKPVGFKLALGQPWEWFAIAKAMQQADELPDFIVVDGGEGGTGAAPLEFTNHVGMPLRDGLMLVHNTLVGLNLRHKVRIAAAGKIVTAFDITRALALGADWCNAARGFMFAVGCIQSQTCHTGKCPTGVATQNQLRQRALVVPDKAARVHQFHSNTLKSLAELLAAAGLSHPSQVGPEHISRRISPSEVKSFAALHRFLESGELLRGSSEHPTFNTFWPLADPISFAVPASVLSLRARKDC